MTRFLSILLLIVFTFSCGGGSDDSNEFFGAGVVNLNIAPNKVDPEDRVRATIDISSIHADGIALKINFPEELEFVKGSSVFFTRDRNNDEEEITPNISTSSEKAGNFLVFYITPDDFDLEEENRDGTVQLELVALEKLSQDGEISVDIDVLDANEISSFSVEEPKFDPEDSKNIIIG